MAVVIPVEKLLKGLRVLTSSSPIWVKLRNKTTSYRDRDTGWYIKGNQVKELPFGNTGVPSQSLLIAIRAGRFVRVCEQTAVSTKTDDLIDYILKESGQCDVLREIPLETG